MGTGKREQLIANCVPLPRERGTSTLTHRKACQKQGRQPSVNTHMLDKITNSGWNPITTYLKLEEDSEIELSDFSNIEGSGIMSGSGR